MHAHAPCNFAFLQMAVIAYYYGGANVPTDMESYIFYKKPQSPPARPTVRTRMYVRACARVCMCAC